MYIICNFSEFYKIIKHFFNSKNDYTKLKIMIEFNCFVDVSSLPQVLTKKYLINNVKLLE